MAMSKEVHKMDSREDIDRCLNCGYKDCTDVCPYSPYYKAYLCGKKNREKRKTQAEESEKINQAKKVADMYRLGWSMTGIACELGITREQAVESMKFAIKKKFYK